MNMKQTFRYISGYCISPRVFVYIKLSFLSKHFSIRNDKPVADDIATSISLFVELLVQPIHNGRHAEHADDVVVAQREVPQVVHREADARKRLLGSVGVVIGESD